MNQKPLQAFLLVAAAAVTAFGQQPAAQPPAAPPAEAGQAPEQPKKTVKSQAEQEAITAIVKAKKPSEIMAKVDDFVVKFPNSDFKSAVLLEAAKAADQGQDVTHVVTYGDMAIEADPQNAEAMLLVAGELAQHTKTTDLDKNDKLAKAEKYVNQAIQIIPNTPKTDAKISDADWEASKKTALAGGHYDLGLIAMARGKAAQAASEYQMAVDSAGGSPDPVWLVRLGDADLRAGKADVAIPIFDKVIAMQDVLPQVKQVATSEKAAAEKMVKK